MPHQTIPIQLPEAIYQRLQQVAHATHHSIEEVVLQTIRGNLPPALDDLSPELRDIEPIIPLVSGGSSTPDNLCLACYRCNEFKGSRTEAADPRDGQLTPAARRTAAIQSGWNGVGARVAPAALRFVVVHASQLEQQQAQSYAAAQAKATEVGADHVRQVQAR